MSRTRGASLASHDPHTSPEALDGHGGPPALDRAECGGWVYLGECRPPLLFMVEYCPKTWQVEVGGALV